MTGTWRLTVRQRSPARRWRAGRCLLAAAFLLASLALADYLSSREEVATRPTSAPERDPQQLVADLTFATALFGTLLRNYAESVVAWTPERFQLLPFKGDATAPQATVRTQVLRAAGSFASVDYRLHRTGEDWQVFDVLVDGISYVRTYHDDVDSDVTQRGPEFALERIEKAAQRTEQPADSLAR